MKKVLPIVILILMVMSGFIMNNKPAVISNTSFSKGEILKYKVHYGPITAAEAVIDIAPTLHNVNGKPCYKATVYGKTNSSFDMFLKVRDTWQSYIDTAAIVPQRFFRNIEEGNYRKREVVDFNHLTNTATVEMKKNKANKETNTYKVPNNVQDMVSGFYFLRTQNYDKLKIGEKINVKGFLEDETFDMVVTYKGKETVSTKAGEIRAIKLVPAMPNNKLFKGENAITVYLSDDKNKIPVLIEAALFVGSVKVDLYEYKNLRHNLYIAKN